MSKNKMNYLYTFFVFLSVMTTSHLLGSFDKARISELKGNVFIITSNKITTDAQKGDVINDLTEVVVSEGSHVSIIDFIGRVIHLTQGSHIKLLGRTIQLFEGNAWIQVNDNVNDDLSLSTANAQVTHKKGDAIISFDKTKQKTQVYVLNGQFNFRGIVSEVDYVVINPKEFSFVEKNYQTGLPRAPTPIGKESLPPLMALFKEVDTLSARQEMSHYLADQHQKELEVDESHSNKKTKKVKPSRKIASVTTSAFPSHAKTHKKIQKSHSDIRIYGLENKRTPADTKKIVDEHKVESTENVEDLLNKLKNISPQYIQD